MSTWLWGLSVAVCLLPVRIQRLRVVAVWWWPWHSTGFHRGDPELRSLAIAFWSDKSEDVLFVALRCVLHYMSDMSVSRDFPLPAGFKWFQCNMPHRSSQILTAEKRRGSSIGSWKMLKTSAGFRWHLWVHDEFLQVDCNRPSLWSFTVVAADTFSIQCRNRWINGGYQWRCGWPSSFRLAESIGIPNPDESRVSSVSSRCSLPLMKPRKSSTYVWPWTILKPCFRQIELTIIDPSLQTFLMGGL